MANRRAPDPGIMPLPWRILVVRLVGVMIAIGITFATIAYSGL